MTVAELIAELQNMDDDSAEVRLAFQPEWPLEYNLGEVLVLEAGAEFDGVYPVRDDDGWYLSEDDGRTYVEAGPFDTEQEASEWLEMTRDNASDREPVVYLAEAGQIGYLDPVAKRQLGWVRG